jgi:hypothetical protein
MSIDLSIIIVSYNTRALLSDCLRSVEATAGDLTYEVVVVDNGSSDGSADAVARGYPAVRLICNEHNVGFAAANNQGIRASSGRHVLLLNSDALLLPGTAARMVRFLDEHPRVGAVGGKLLNPDLTFQASFNDFPSFLDEVLALTGASRWLRPPTYPSYPESRSGERRPVEWVGGACMMVRRQAVDAVGLLDEDYFMYSEEMDWCFRLRRAGWSIFYLPEATTVHALGASSRRVPERRRTLIYQSKCLFLRKHRGCRRARVFRRLVQAVSLVKLATWLSASIVGGSPMRDVASQQAASHRFLLRHL